MLLRSYVCGACYHHASVLLLTATTHLGNPDGPVCLSCDRKNVVVPWMDHTAIAVAVFADAIIFRPLISKGDLVVQLPSRMPGDFTMPLASTLVRGKSGSTAHSVASRQPEPTAAVCKAVSSYLLCINKYSRPHTSDHFKVHGT